MPAEEAWFLSWLMMNKCIDIITPMNLLFYILYYHDIIFTYDVWISVLTWAMYLAGGGVGLGNGERVMRRCGGIYSVFYVLLKLIDMQWPQYGDHGPHLCTVQVFPWTFLKMRRPGCALMFASTLLPRKRETPYRIIKLTVFLSSSSFGSLQ
jgi:hypothetical protein